MEAGLSELKKMRESWAKRENDPLIARVDEKHRRGLPAVPASEAEAIAKVARWKATLKD